MRRFKLSLIVKITLMVVMAFGLILGNEIRLGIDRYSKNTIESDAETLVRKLDKFSRDYNNLTVYEGYELESEEFKAIYNNALNGNPYLIKSLVSPQGKILDISRETIDSTILCIIPKVFEDHSDWPSNYAMFLYLDQMNKKDINALEDYMVDGKPMMHIALDVVFDKNSNFKQNDFKNISIQRLKIEDDIIIDHDVSKDALSIEGTLSFYSSQNKEVFFGNNAQMLAYGDYTKKNDENKEAVVIDYRDAIAGIRYQLQKNFNDYIKDGRKFLVSNYAQYYLLDSYRYNNKDYSSVMVPIFDIVKYNKLEADKPVIDDDLKEQCILGYMIVTNEYSNLTANSLQQFIVDNSSTYFIAIVLIALISVALAYMIVIPIRRIERSTKHIARKEFDYPIDMSGNDELGSLANSIDLMSKELEKTIRHLYKEINRVKGLENLRKEFVSNFTHEIKTPLGIINGFGELAELEEDKDKRNEYLHIIQSETAKINGLVKAMLDYSRMESKNITLDLEDVDLLEVLDETLDELSYLVDKKHIKVHRDVVSTVVNVDRFRMAMVFNNLLSNTIRYCNVDGNLRIVLNDHMFSVENEGPLIPDEDLSKVWLTFHKVDKSRSDEGTGLGLSICRAVFELHHFDYGVENTEGGVRFYFYF